MVTELLDHSFKALADPTRREILARLLSGPRPVWELSAYFEMSRPAVSKHLKQLKEAGLVAEDRRGRERFYRLIPGPLSGVGEWLDAIEAGEAPLEEAASRRRRGSTTPQQGLEPAGEPPESSEGEDEGDWRAW